MNTLQILKQVCSLIDREIESSIHKEVVPYKEEMSAEFNTLRDKIKYIEAHMREVNIKAGNEVGPRHTDIITTSGRVDQLTISKEEVPVGVLDTPLCNLTYYQGALRPLRNAGITHVKDVIYKSDKELLRIKNFGLGKLHVVRKSIEDFIKQYESLENIL